MTDTHLVAGFPPLSAQRPTGVRFLVLALIATSAVAAYITRVALAPAATTIQAELGFDTVQIGAILGGWSLSYALLQLPCAWLGDRVGRRVVLPAAALAWALCTLWTATAYTFRDLWWSRCLLGVAQAALIPNVARLVVDWFPEGRRGFTSSVFASSMSTGSVLATGITGLLMLVLDWRHILEVYAGVSVLWAVAFAVAFRNRPENHPWVNEAEVALIRTPPPKKQVVAPEEEGIRAKPLSVPVQPATAEAVVLAMLTSSSNWLLNGQAFFRAYFYAFFTSWFPAYLEKGHGLKVAEAGLLTMLPLAGVIVGSLSGGLLVDALLRVTGSRWVSRSAVAAGSMALTGVGFLVAVGADSPWFALTILTLGALASGPAHPATWATTLDIGGKHTASVMALANMTGNVGAACAPVAVGYLLQTYQGNWEPVLLMFMGANFGGAACWFFLNPNRSAVERAAPATG